MLELGWPSLVKLMHSSTSKLWVSIISSHLVSPNCCVFLKRQSLAHIWETGCPFKSPSTSNWPGMVAYVTGYIPDNRTIFMVSIDCTIVECTKKEGSLRPNCWHLSRLMGTLNMWCLERIFSTYQRLNIINASENGTGLHSYHPLDVAIHLECGYGWRTRTCDNFLLFGLPEPPKR